MTSLSVPSDLFTFFCNGKTPIQAPESASKSQQDPLLLLLYPVHLHSRYCTDPGSSPCYLFPMIRITFLLIPMPPLHGLILNTARAILQSIALTQIHPCSLQPPLASQWLGMEHFLSCHTLQLTPPQPFFFVLTLFPTHFCLCTQDFSFCDSCSQSFLPYSSDLVSPFSLSPQPLARKHTFIRCLSHSILENQTPQHLAEYLACYGHPVFGELNYSKWILSDFFFFKLPLSFLQPPSLPGIPYTNILEPMPHLIFSKGKSYL